MAQRRGRFEKLRPPRRMRTRVNQPADADADVLLSEQRYRRTEVRSSTWQTWVAVAAFTLSVPSFWVSALTVSDQVKVNRAQRTMLQEQLERERRRYVDRVTWWDEHDQKRASTIHIQNRTTAPITRVELASVAVEVEVDPVVEIFEGRVFVGDVAPCTLLTVTVPLQVRNGIVGEWFTGSMAFRDGMSRAWRKTATTTEELRSLPSLIEGDAAQTAVTAIDEAWLFGPEPPSDVPWLDTLGPLPVSRQALSDCGP